MALSGQFSELAGFMQKLKKLPDAPREIAVKLAPVVSALVDETFAAQASPTGDAWPATKSGAPAFGGGASLGHVLSRLVGRLSIRTTVLYPLHFHQDGTHKIGRKRGRAIAKTILGAERKSVTAAYRMPRRRKNETYEAFQARKEKAEETKKARQDAWAVIEGLAKRKAAAAVEEARTAGGWHDPPRPMIPNEGDPIPPRWVEEISATARDIMAQYGAEERG